MSALCSALCCLDDITPEHYRALHEVNQNLGRILLISKVEVIYTHEKEE